MGDIWHRMVRIVLIAWFSMFTLSAIYLHVFAPHLLGSGRGRAEMLGRGIAHAISIVGATLSIPFTWFVAVGVVTYECWDVLRISVRRPVAEWRERTAWLETGFGFVNAALLMLLASQAGRATFGVAPWQ